MHLHVKSRKGEVRKWRRRFRCIPVRVMTKRFVVLLVERRPYGNRGQRLSTMRMMNTVNFYLTFGDVVTLAIMKNGSR